MYTKISYGRNQFRIVVS